MSELKGCPFCGGEAELSLYRGSFDYNRPKANTDYYKAECPSCFISVSGSESDKKSATTAWNTRNHTRAIEKIEALKANDMTGFRVPAYDDCLEILKGE